MIESMTRRQLGRLACVGLAAALTACNPFADEGVCEECLPRPAVVLTATAGEGGSALTDVVVEDAVDGGPAVEVSCGPNTDCTVVGSWGTHHLVIRREGYVTIERDVEVQPHRYDACCTVPETVGLTVALTPAP